MTATDPHPPAEPISYPIEPDEFPAGAKRHVRTPTVLQFQVAECGPACLAMVLAHYGRYVTLDELRDKCGASRDGTTAGDLVRVGASYGLYGAGYRAQPDELAQYDYPLILHWQYGHFVVLEWIDDQKAIINDPAKGRRSVDRAEFDNAYSGVALRLRPNPGFTTGGSRPGRALTLLKRVRPVRHEVAAAAVVGLLLALPLVLLAVIAGTFVSTALVTQSRAVALGLTTAAAALVLIQWALATFQQRTLRRAGLSLNARLSSEFTWHSLRLPEKYFVSRTVSDLANRVLDNSAVAQLLTGRTATVTVSLVMVTVLGVAMLVISPPLGAIAVSLNVINFLVLRRLLRRQQDLANRASTDLVKLGEATTAPLQSFETVKATGAETDAYARWEGALAKLMGTQRELARVSKLTSALPAMISAIIASIVLCSGGYLVIRGLLSIGAFVAFQSIAAGFSAPIAQFVTFTSSIQEVRTLSERLDDALQEQVDSTTQGDLYPRGITEENLRLDGRIDLRDVSFGFKSTRPPLISDLTLSVPAGQRVAIVGGSGSGKSTVVRLIAGLHTPWSGEVLLDGLEHEDVPRPVFRASVAMVDQTIALFHGTVRDNLTLWDPTVSEEDIVRACQDAQIHDLIVSRPGGYDSMVEEGGRNFSGGQRQRLEIARSLVRNPTILLLDEATSALDAETEALIDWALRRRGCTCIIVAHRLSTVRDADLIVLLEKGRDIERGTHDELIAFNGHYAELVAQ